MLLTVTNRSFPARDLGYLLRKHPDRMQAFELPFGSAHVFYPKANDDVCTAAFFLEVDPVALVRGKSSSPDGGLVDSYVNDRAYVASSFLSVAIARTLGPALNGRCDRPGLAESILHLEATVEPVREGTEEVVQRLFVPLGYAASSSAVDVPASGLAGVNYRVGLSASTTLAQLLNHLYVLIPVLDGSKHYWVGDDEVEKLFRFGKDWLPNHPEREFITKRYLRRAPSLARAAVARLNELDDAIAPGVASTSISGDAERALEKPLRLQERRIAAVVDVLRRTGAASVVDMGCGDGDLIAALATESAVGRVVGTDVSVRELERAKARLDRLSMASSRKERITLFQSSALYYDRRLDGADAITMMEVVEHIDLDRHPALERVIFGSNRPKAVIVTTPNAEYNALFPNLVAGTLRHPDHRFEWSRAEFRDWGERVALQYGYGVAFEPVGDSDASLGAPTQMAVFRCG